MPKPGDDPSFRDELGGCLRLMRHVRACARARVMGSYISNRNACAHTWSLFNDDHCSLSENRTRMSRSNLSRKALVSADAECGLSHTGLPLKRKFRPRCCAKTRARVHQLRFIELPKRRRIA